jgi:hypothetical protein
MTEKNKGGNNMKKIMVLFALVSMVGFAAEALAQRGMDWKGGGGWGPNTHYHRMYNPQTIENITGEVVAIDMITPMKGMGYGVHMMVKTDQETISVHLGPSWYIENQDIKIEVGDKIEVRGSRIIFDDAPSMIAAEVKKGGETLILRDKNGFPVWSGWRRR